MSSGGGKTTTTVQNSGPPEWAQNYFRTAFDRANQISQQPYVGYGGPRVAGFSPDQLQGFDDARFQASKNYDMSGIGDAYVSDMLAGKGGFKAEQNPYAGQNPYLGDMIANAQQDVTRAYQNSVVPQTLSQFNAGGAFGGTAMQQAMAEDNRGLAEQLGRVSTNLRNADYDRQAQLADSYLGRQQSAWAQDMSNRQGALGMIPSLAQSRFSGAQALGNIGLQQQGLLQSALDADYGDFIEQRDWDKNNLGLLTGALGALNGGGQSSSSSAANPNYRSAGQNALTAAALAAMFFSDESIKENKTPMDSKRALDAVQKMPVETWSYKGDAEQHAGTYSQDFYKALGMEPKEYINSIDMFGALTGAVQELAKKVNKGKS